MIFMRLRRQGINSIVFSFYLVITYLPNRYKNRLITSKNKLPKWSRRPVSNIIICPYAIISTILQEIYLKN